PDARAHRVLARGRRARRLARRPGLDVPAVLHPRPRAGLVPPRALPYARAGASTRGMSERVRLGVAAGAEGERLDHFLVRSIPGSTRSALGRLIAEGRVTVDGSPAGKAGL